MKLNSDQLLSFVALVQTGSVGAAAKMLHLTQPAISNQLKRLQDVMGVALYRRQGRSVVLTAMGESFYHYATNVQKSLREAEAFADDLVEVSAGRVYLSASQTIAGSLLPAALVKFRQLFPQVEVFVDSGNSQQVFQQIERHDLGLVECPLPTTVPSCCRVESLGQDSIVVVMPSHHPLSSFETIELEQLAGYPLIWRESGSGTRDVLEQALLKAYGQNPEIHLCLGGVSAMLEAVRQGLGIGVVSQFCLPSGESMLTTRAFQPQLCRPMSLLIPAHASAVAKKFACFLTPYLREKLKHRWL
ncbi:MAG: LysR substrate-binding domain-containing protein [Mariprofundales bacterium]